jgi:hypothetical protein
MLNVGSIEDVWRVFNSMLTHNVVSWTAMLQGFAMHRHGAEALGHFQWMCEECIEVDAVTFVFLLSASSHAGLVDEDLLYCQSMGSVYGVSPTVQHSTCMVDLLGHASHLQRAEDLINTMSCELNAGVWMVLLGASRIHGDMELGECIAK